MDELTYYATQSIVTNPGGTASWLVDLPSDLDGLRRIARELVIHYRGDDPAGHGIPAERFSEIDTRYAAAMLTRLRELRDRPLTEPRPPVDRLVGCCRDFTVLFLTLARHQGIPARARVGFATYFVPGYVVDHEVAEVWDETAHGWRLVDAELGDSHVDPNDGARVDGLDVPRDRFLVGGAAWLACKQGDDDPARFMVDPNLDIPETRGWPQLRHNTIHDLAALNKQELLLWDDWGLLEVERLSAAQERLVDAVAEATANSVDWDEIRGLYELHPELRVPEIVTSIDPLGGSPRAVLLAQ